MDATRWRGSRAPTVPGWNRRANRENVRLCERWRDPSGRSPASGLSHTLNFSEMVRTTPRSLPGGAQPLICWPMGFRLGRNLRANRFIDNCAACAGKRISMKSCSAFTGGTPRGLDQSSAAGDSNTMVSGVELSVVINVAGGPHGVYHRSSASSIGEQAISDRCCRQRRTGIASIS